MPFPPPRRPAAAVVVPVASALVAVLLALVVLAVPPGASAQSVLTVAQAGAAQGTTATVRGYVVGQPVASATVVTAGFPGDLAIALADSPAETDTDRMLYVQLTAPYRSAFGLASNPDLIGTRLDVTGPLTAYFAHPGLKAPSAVTPSPGEQDPPPGGGDDDGGSTSPYDDTYYATALGLSGGELRDALHDIIDGNDTVTYAQVWEALRDTDADPAAPGNVLTLYSGLSLPASDNGGGADDWNREHVWAKSHGGFGTAVGPGTDLHHLRPEDVSVNAARGSLDFDEGGSTVSQCSGCARDGDSFEPPDRVKGDVARMILYMAVRYEGGDGWPDLEVNDAVGNGPAPALGRLSVLLTWNTEDPPDAFELRRNDRIQQRWQHNRNPFIDHPEWVDAIWG